MPFGPDRFAFGITYYLWLQTLKARAEFKVYGLALKFRPNPNRSPKPESKPKPPKKLRPQARLSICQTLEPSPQNQTLEALEDPTISGPYPDKTSHKT